MPIQKLSTLFRLGCICIPQVKELLRCMRLVSKFHPLFCITMPPVPCDDTSAALTLVSLFGSSRASMGADIIISLISLEGLFLRLSPVPRVLFL